MATPVYIAAIATTLTGYVMILLAHAGDFGGWMGPLAVFGPMVFAFGIVIGEIGGQIRNPYILFLTFAAVTIAFIAFGVYDSDGLRWLT